MYFRVKNKKAEVIFLGGIMRPKEKYRIFCESEDQVPIFSKDWWLDAVCGKDGWDVVLVEKNNKIVASMPYVFKKKLGCLMLYMPKLTQHLGPYIVCAKGLSYTKKLSFEMEMMEQLISLLPKFADMKQKFSTNISNWLPFYWAGFQQTTKYTYVIPNLKDLDALFSVLLMQSAKI